MKNIFILNVIWFLSFFTFFARFSICLFAVNANYALASATITTAAATRAPNALCTQFLSIRNTTTTTTTTTRSTTVISHIQSQLLAKWWTTFRPCIIACRRRRAAPRSVPRGAASRRSSRICPRAVPRPRAARPATDAAGPPPAPKAHASPRAPDR